MAESSFTTGAGVATAGLRKVFHDDALEVLGGLRTAMSGVLASIGGLRKPADVQRQLKLDWTLSWQIFNIGGPTTNDASILSVGSKVPSRSALKRFLDVAERRGVAASKISAVWSSFDRVEGLVEAHAGDRTSFISMVSAASGIDGEWQATDAQHRRHAFRAMSHFLGRQAVTKHSCSIFTEAADGRHWDIATVAGNVGFRVLRSFESVPVSAGRVNDPDVRQQVRREPIGDDLAIAGGYLMTDFSTAPLPPLTTYETDGGWLTTHVRQPPVGKTGECTLRFGTVYRGQPIPGLEDGKRDFHVDVVVDKPVELVISDMLVKPGLTRGGVPTGQVLLGVNYDDRPALPGEVVPLIGQYEIERLGHGPDALMTPEVPEYAALMRAAARKLGCDIDAYEALRLRVDFPVYQSRIRMFWEVPAV